MKRLFTMLFVVVTGMTLNSTAQTTIPQITLYKEDFESPAAPVLPTGWGQLTVDTPDWVSFKGLLNLSASSWVTSIPPHTQYALVDDWNATTAKNNANILTSPNINFVNIGNGVLSFEYFFVGAQSVVAEDAYVMISTDAGVTWSPLAKMDIDNKNWQHMKLSLAKYNNVQNIMIGFSYDDMGGHMVGLAIDDVEILIDDTPPPPPPGGGPDDNNGDKGNGDDSGGSNPGAKDNNNSNTDHSGNHQSDDEQENVKNPVDADRNVGMAAPTRRKTSDKTQNDKNKTTYPFGTNNITTNQQSNAGEKAPPMEGEPANNGALNNANSSANLSVGSNDKLVIDHIAVFPNPAIESTKLSFVLNETSLVDVQVTDAMGRLVYTNDGQMLNAGPQIYTLDIHGYIPGAYTIKVRSSSGIITQRLNKIE